MTRSRIIHWLQLPSVYWISFRVFQMKFMTRISSVKSDSMCNNFYYWHAFLNTRDNCPMPLCSLIHSAIDPLINCTYDFIAHCNLKWNDSMYLVSTFLQVKAGWCVYFIDVHLHINNDLKNSRRGESRAGMPKSEFCGKMYDFSKPTQRYLIWIHVIMNYFKYACVSANDGVTLKLD